MSENEKSELTPFPVPVAVSVRNLARVISLQPISIPVNWVDALAFSGKGFVITVNFPDAVKLEKGSTIRVAIGEVLGPDGDENIPFDPPYASNAKQST